MAYTVYITRDTAGPADTAEPDPISQQEWHRYVAADPEMQLYDYAHDPLPAEAGAEADAGYQAYLEGLAAWLGQPAGAEPGSERAWFSHQRGQVLVEDPDPDTLRKARSIARALQARLKDDDNYLDELPAAPRPAETRPIWAESDFRQFRVFASLGDAAPLLAALEARGVAFETVRDNGQLAFDPSFANQPRVGGFVVKLRLPDFELAWQLQEQLNEERLPELSADYYLFAFGDAELFDVLTRPDEWSSLDVTLARVLLRERGRDLSPDTLQLLRQHRLLELARPDTSFRLWVRAGYFFALLGGVLGVLIGWQLYFHRKTLPDGRRLYAYTPADRRHGLRIVVLGLLVFGLLLLIRAMEWQPTYSPGIVPLQ